MIRRLTVLLLGFCLLTPVFATEELLLAKRWGDQFDPADYWVSEKLDGVRAYWDGKQLWTRAGHPISAPAWFTEGFPEVELDGELWAGRGRFERASATVRRGEPRSEEWREIEYRLFELPNAGGDFTARFGEMVRLTEMAKLPWLRPVEQFRILNHSGLQARLLEVTEAGGEGLMLHRADAPYLTGRSDVLLKLKRYEDAEAQVVAQFPGQGRLVGKMGALEVVSTDGRRFRVGSGFSDAERENPPPIGSVITYRFNGLTANGLPRFPRYLRLREQ